MKKQYKDYIVVGQGIAGTFFANELYKNKKSFIVIDPDKNSASKTAAGMYNPIILKRFSPVWQADVQIKQAKKTLNTLEGLLDNKFDYPLKIQRVFHNEKEKETWVKKSQSGELSPFLEKETEIINNKKIIAPFGLGNIKKGGRANLDKLLSLYRYYLKKENKLIEGAFDYGLLNIKDNTVVYNGITAKKVVFCEGYGIKRNPFFNYLPLNGNKGEVLIVRLTGLNINTAIKSNVFIMPLVEKGEDVYFVGSTYNWLDKDDTPSHAARDYLLNKLSFFVKGDVEVLEHRAGIRPTVIDRRPLLGNSKKYPNLYILNGLGTRGIMLGATMAKHLYRFAEEDILLPNSININRFSCE